MEQVKYMQNMVEDLDMEVTNNSNLALLFEVVDWFNIAYR